MYIYIMAEISNEILFENMLALRITLEEDYSNESIIIKDS